MKQKAHGTSHMPVQENLRWGVSEKSADRICNFNRRSAEPSGYFARKSLYFFDDLKAFQQEEEGMTFYDSNTGKPLFRVPVNELKTFWRESKLHGWPSFRDEHVIWKHARCLRGRKHQEVVSLDGTHLGHNLPDSKGNRYCVNLVSIAGRPENDGIIYYINHDNDEHN